MYLLKLSFRPWRLAPFSQVFSAMAVGFLLLLSGFLFWLQQGLKPVVDRLQGEQVVTAYLDPATDAKEEGRIVDSIKLAAGAHAETQLVGPQQFIGKLKARYPDLSRELEDLGSEADAVVPRYVSVAGLLTDQTAEKIQAIPGIESVESSKDRYQHIVGAFRALRWVSRVLAVGLCLALLTGLVHLARMNASLHHDALSLLRLWGANNLVVRTPGMVSGFCVGILGGLIAASGWISGGAWLARHVRELSPMLHELPVASTGFSTTLLLCGAALGIFAGIFGAPTSVSRADRG